MILTEMYDGQGLGNQLWVYAAARSVAEQLDLPFILLGAERFKGKDFLNIVSNVGISEKESANIIKSRNWRSFHETLFFDPDLNYVASGFDQRVLTLKGINKLDGLFQSEKYFFGDLDRPKKYFILKSDYKTKNHIPDDTCIINLRGGEYKRHKNFILPDAYWEKAIMNMKRFTNVREFLVVTDDVKYARALFPKIDVLKGGIGECYASLFNAKFLILSNSSFAYFPIKTSGNSQFVIAPMYWARHSNQYKRWASPANLYESWMWQSPDGNLLTYEECCSDRESTEDEYEVNFFVRTRLEQVQKMGIKKFIPTVIKKKTKSILSLIFPRNFG